MFRAIGRGTHSISALRIGTWSAGPVAPDDQCCCRDLKRAGLDKADPGPGPVKFMGFHGAPEFRPVPMHRDVTQIGKARGLDQGLFDLCAAAGRTCQVMPGA